MKVLIVDDSGPVRRIMRRMFQEMGHEAFEAADGKEALSQLKADAGIGLMMLDWNMPTMDGMQLLEALQSKEGSIQKPTVILVSTENQMEKIVYALSKGADEYIMKPFTKEILEEKLAILGIESGSHA